jgi:serine/threonine protein kinase
VASLSHPNIVRIYELCADEEELSLVFEFVEGKTLRQLLNERGLLPTEIAVVISNEILKGLAAAHEKGIIHRDLKPENVLVSERGEVKIADFGLAIVKDLPRLTLEGVPVGTAKYMAPEQVTGEEVTPQSDLFAMGLILFEMLTGQSVLKGKTWQECLQELLLYQLPRFSDYRHAISTEMERILSALLERSPARRYENARAAREALALALAAIQLSPPDLLHSFLERSPAKAASGIQPTKSESKHRVRLVVMWAIPLLVATLAIVIYIMNRDGESNHQNTEESRQSDSTHDTIPTPIITPSESPRTEIPALKESLSNETVQTEPPKKLARLLISCDSLTEVIVDNQSVGVALRDTLFLSPGMHHVRLKNDVIPMTMDTAITLVEDQFETLSVNLCDRAPKAKLFVVCQDWGDVSIDGEKHGRTPLRGVELRACRHRVSIQNRYFPVDIDTTVNLRAGETDTLFVSFYDYVGLLRVIWVNPGADIFVDNVKAGSTPIAKPIPVTLRKEHTIRLENPSYARWDTTIFFNKPDTLDLRVDLTKTM